MGRLAIAALWSGILVSMLIAPAHAGVMAYWKFDETSGQTVADETGVNHGMLGNSTGADSHDPALGQPGRLLRRAWLGRRRHQEALSAQCGDGLVAAVVRQPQAGLSDYPAMGQWRRSDFPAHGVRRLG